MTPGSHLGTVILGERPLRQYAAMHGEPDHPWTLAGDLAAFAEMSEGQCAEWLDGLRKLAPEFLDELPDGAPIVAEPIISGLFQVWLDIGCEAAGDLLRDWRSGWSEVFVAHHCHLPGPEWLVVCRMAELRNVVHVPGVTVVS